MSPSRRLCALALVAGLLLLPAAALAQGGDGLRVESSQTESFPEVSLTVSVPFDLGAGAEDAFTLLEDGEPRAVQAQHLDEADLEVILLIDITASMAGSPLATVKEAASEFVRKLPAGLSLSVVGYNTELTIVSDFSADAQGHLRGIRELQAGRGSATYDSVVQALALFDGRPDVDRALLMLTDGEDNRSRLTLERAAALVAASGVTVHAVEFITDVADQPAIHQLVAAGGGEVRRADDLAGLASFYDEMTAHLTQRYRLRYRSQGAGPTEAHIKAAHEGRAVEAFHTLSLPDAGPPAASQVVTAPGLFGSSTAMMAGVGAVYVALALALLSLIAPGRHRTRLAGVGSSRIAGLSNVSDWMTVAVERKLQRRGSKSTLNAKLERAGINLRPGEFVVLAGSVTVVAAMLGWALGGVLLGLLFLLFSVLVARLGVSFLGDRRSARFADQLGDTLQLLAGSLRAGYSVLQAIDAVAREAESPTAEEFRRLVVETRLGRDMGEALDLMAQRMGCQDFEWVVQAIAIQRDVGGDLAEVLDTVAETIRERNQIRRQVKALSAEGKLSAIILFALPFAVGGMVMLTNPEYLSELVTTVPGRIMLGVGAVLLAIGGAWLRKVVKVVF